jgi:hypothetical protein
VSGLTYSDKEPHIYCDSGDWVDVLSRGCDTQGAYVEVQFSDRYIKRVHPSMVRPLTWIELFEYRIVSGKRR